MTKLVPLLYLLAACGDDPPAPDTKYDDLGEYAVGTRRFELTDAARSRTLVVQAWYPSPTALVTPLVSFEIEPIQGRYSLLVRNSPYECAASAVPAQLDGVITEGSYPLVLISHCHSCTRLSNATTATMLASHGFVTLSVEHLGDTLWETLDGMEAPIDGPTVELRAADMRFVLDQVEAGATPISDVADLEHVGVLGHSMGAVTAGRTAMLDARIDAAGALAAPMENALTPGVDLDQLTVPLFFLVAGEDNSITELGNILLRNNFRDAPVPAWKIELPDAGHWSVSDLVGIIPAFEPGCRYGVRQTDGTDFEYTPPVVARDITSAYVTAFFAATLRDDAGARAYVSTASTSFGVALDVEHK